MNDKNKTVAMGAIIAGILMLAYYAAPANGISFGDKAGISSLKTTQLFVPSLTPPPRGGGGGCGV